MTTPTAPPPSLSQICQSGLFCKITIWNFAYKVVFIVTFFSISIGVLLTKKVKKGILYYCIVIYNSHLTLVVLATIIVIMDAGSKAPPCSDMPHTAQDLC